MFSPKLIRIAIEQSMTWSAMLMLLVHPFCIPVANCGCQLDSRSTVEQSGCCSNFSKTCCDEVAPCCSAEPFSCSSQSSDCAAPETDFGLPCKCGHQCRCGSIDGPYAPAPVIPTNNSPSEQSQWLILAIQSTVGIDCEMGSEDLRQPKLAQKYSLTAQQVCALLSRFTC